MSKVEVWANGCRLAAPVDAGTQLDRLGDRKERKVIYRRRLAAVEFKYRSRRAYLSRTGISIRID